MENESGQADRSTYGAQIITKFWDSVLNLTKKWLNEKTYELIAKWLLIIGNYALMLTAAIGLIFALVGAIKSDSFRVFVMGLAWVLIVSIMLYVVDKFADAGETLIRSNPTGMSSVAFLDSISLISLVGGALGMIILTIAAIQEKEIEPFFIGVGLLVGSQFLVCIAANPGLLNISISSGTGAGQEMLGIFSFFMKAVLKFVPIGYGIVVIYGTINFLIAFIKVFSSEFQAIAMGTSAATMLIAASLIPLFAYLTFLMYYLMIDLVGSVLVLPKKIDMLRSGGDKTQAESVKQGEQPQQ